MYKTLLITLMSLALGACLAAEEMPTLIPKSEQMQASAGRLDIKDIHCAVCPADFRTTMESWAGQIKMTCDIEISIKDKAKKPYVKVIEDNSLAREQYMLDISRRQITIRCSHSDGLSRAMATLLQLMAQTSDGSLPCLSITDAPQYGYRGLMLDCSRHFWTAAEIEQTIRHMAVFKLNKLHLHLTDNEGWRLPVDTHPELTASADSYTKDELIHLVSVAEALGIEIIPEADLPGHSGELLRRLPHLACKDSTVLRRQTSRSVVCVANEDTYRFIDDVVRNLADIFPSGLIHLGGDEVSTSTWEQCPDCMELYRADGMSDPHQLQDHFTQKVSKIAHEYGKRMIGWDEINDRGAASEDDIIMAWQRDGMSQQAKAVSKGQQIIMSPRDPCYFDFGYSRNSTRSVYSWRPLHESSESLVLGGQANLWTEFVAYQDDVERMYWPRAAALAETLWTTDSTRDWTDFCTRLDSLKPLMKSLGINFYDGMHDHPGFCPATEEKPATVLPATFTTDITGCKFFHPEYAFDGDARTFFSTSWSIFKGQYFEMALDVPAKAQTVRVIFDESKEYPERLDLKITTAQESAITVTCVLKDGVMTASLDSPAEIKSVRLLFPEGTKNRITIREIEFR